jgi:hypothetical protein
MREIVRPLCLLVLGLLAAAVSPPEAAGQTCSPQDYCCGNRICDPVRIRQTAARTAGDVATASVSPCVPRTARPARPTVRRSAGTACVTEGPEKTAPPVPPTVAGVSRCLAREAAGSWTMAAAGPSTVAHAACAVTAFPRRARTAPIVRATKRSLPHRIEGPDAARSQGTAFPPRTEL